MTGERATDPMYNAIERTARFVWANPVSVVGISVGWFVAAMPIVTIGPATVGAYRAVLSVREGEGGVDRSAVVSTVRRQFVHATLLGLLPLVLFLLAANYAIAYLATGVVGAGLIALGCGYVAVYAWLVSVPTLLGLADGESPTAALRDGYHWTARHAVGAIALGVVTVVVFAVTALLTVAVALSFAGIVFALHVEFVSVVGGRARRRASPKAANEVDDSGIERGERRTYASPFDGTGEPTIVSTNDTDSRTEVHQ